jgi:hypothetical protein
MKDEFKLMRKVNDEWIEVEAGKLTSINFPNFPIFIIWHFPAQLSTTSVVVAQFVSDC